MLAFKGAAVPIVHVDAHRFACCEAEVLDHIAPTGWLEEPRDSKRVDIRLQLEVHEVVLRVAEETCGLALLSIVLLDLCSYPYPIPSMREEHTCPRRRRYKW